MLLNLHSYHSLRYGTLSLDELLDGIETHGYDTAVLTDINNSSASLDFIRLGQKKGLNILAGMEFREGNTLEFVAIARNERGFKEINAYRTRLNAEKGKVTERAPDFDEVFVIYPLHKLATSPLRDHEYIGIRPSEYTKALLLEPKLLQRCVILAPVSFHREDYTFHRQLRAIDNNLLISQLDPQQIARPDEIFIPKATLRKLFAGLPQVWANTERLLSECSFDFDFIATKNKATFTESRYGDKQLLTRYTMEGLDRRYALKDTLARERVLRELDIIENLKFSSYFLMTDDICRYARNRDFHYVGRGSGANSAVAYCLGITDVDPIALHLPFERFLNPKRNSSPDFDIDFSWNERDEIFSYIFKQYQIGHTALMGAVSTFRSNSILRELGKVYGLPKS